MPREKKPAKTGAEDVASSTGERSPAPANFAVAAELIGRNDGDENVDTTLTPEQAKARRLAKRPGIDHLEDGVLFVPDTGEAVPVFAEGDRIVAERHASLLLGRPWLDTRIYLVKSIDDERGFVRCIDEELGHNAYIGFKDPYTRIKLCPAKGNPFTQPKAKNAGRSAPVVNGQGRKGRGRPKGSKNRPREVIEAERKAKRAQPRKRRGRRTR